MLDKLEQIVSRYEELTQELSSPELLSNPSAYGKAAKQQVQEMVRRLLKLEGAPSPDAADALACAIAHAHNAQGLAHLGNAGGRIRRGRLVW